MISHGKARWCGSAAPGPPAPPWCPGPPAEPAGPDVCPAPAAPRPGSTGTGSRVRTSRSELGLKRKEKPRHQQGEKTSQRKLPSIDCGRLSHRAQRSAAAWWGRAPWCPSGASNWSWSPHWEAAAAARTAFLQTAAALECTRRTGRPVGDTTGYQHAGIKEHVEAAVWEEPYPVEGDVELGQEMCDGCSQGPDELHQSTVLHQALVVAAEQVLIAAIGRGVNMTLEPRPLVSVTQQCSKLNITRPEVTPETVKV